MSEGWVPGKRTAWAKAGARWMQLEAAGAQNVLWGVSAEEAEAEEADRDQNVRTLVVLRGLQFIMEVCKRGGLDAPDFKTTAVGAVGDGCEGWRLGNNLGGGGTAVQGWGWV